MKRRKLLFSLLSVCVCLCVVGSSILTASAASSQCLFSPDNFQLDSVFVSGNDAVSWVTPTTYGFTTNDNGSGHFYINTPTGVISYITHWRAKFTPLQGAGALVVEPYMQLNATFYYQHHASGTYANQTITGALYITAPDGTVYEFPVTDQVQSEDQTYFFITVGGTVAVSEGFDFSQCTVEFLFSGLTNVGGVTLDFNQFSLTTKELIGEETAQIVTSIEQGFANLQEQNKDNTQDIIDNQNQNTQDIIDNQDSNTQDIIDNENENAGKTHGFLQNIWDAIVSIPAKIWEYIENGLKSLFVPDQDFIVGYKDKWDTLLSSRFGAVYESSEILIDFAKSIKSADETDTVSIPKVTIPMPENNEFSFGPYEVKIVPDATVLKFLVDTCKTITAVVAVFLLINALRKRWEEVMNVD